MHPDLHPPAIVFGAVKKIDLAVANHSRGVEGVQRLPMDGGHQNRGRQKRLPCLE